MKAGEIQILLHHHINPEPWPYGSSPFYNNTISKFERNGLLDAEGEVTTKGHAYIQRLKEVT